MKKLTMWNVFYIVLGLVFLIIGIKAGNEGSLLLGIFLAVIALYLGFGGKRHRKFEQQPNMASHPSGRNSSETD